MVARKWCVTACGALLGLALGVATLSARVSNLEYLTFSGSVALPGVTLAAGSYSFQVMDSEATSIVVCVRERATHKPVFLGLTQRVSRPPSAAAGRSIVFGEARRGVPTPILEWYPNGNELGHQFIYGR